MNRKPLLTAQFNVYVDGGTKLLGLSEVTLPNFDSLSETLKGAGIMGELDIPGRGQFGAMTMSLAFRILMDDPLTYAVSKTYHFDLRAALSYEDPTNYEQRESKERYSVIGQIKKVDGGKRVPHGFADASIDVAVRRVGHFIDGRQVLEFDPLNDIYTVNGVDIYKEIRAAIS